MSNVYFVCCKSSFLLTSLRSHGGHLLQSFACWEVVATTVLSALCRSCHVRLRSDTFRRLLDDAPLPQGSVSSSELLISQVGSLVPKAPCIHIINKMWSAMFHRLEYRRSLHGL